MNTIFVVVVTINYLKSIDITKFVQNQIRSINISGSIEYNLVDGFCFFLHNILVLLSNFTSIPAHNFVVLCNIVYVFD